MTEIYNAQKEIRKAIPYIRERGTMPSYELNKETSFIYDINTYEKLVENARSYRQQKGGDKKKIWSYICNRRVNKMCSFYCERCFEARPNVNKEDDIYNKTTDLYIDGIPFDIKITTFPKNYQLDFNKMPLIEYLVKNQSDDYKARSKNKIYIALYNNKGEHYKLKGELILIKRAIDAYMIFRDKNNLYNIGENLYDLIQVGL